MSPKKKLTDELKGEILYEHKTKGTSQRDLADKYDISKSTIQRIIKETISNDAIDDEKASGESICF